MPSIFSPKRRFSFFQFAVNLLASFRAVCNLVFSFSNWSTEASFCVARGVLSSASRKEADEKTPLATQKLASVDQLEKENTRLQTALNEANRLTANWKKENLLLGEKMEGISRRRDDLEGYLRSF